MSNLCNVLKFCAAINNKVRKYFLHNFRPFCAVSLSFHLLSATLKSHCFHVFRTALWLNIWSKAPPTFYRLVQVSKRREAFPSPPCYIMVLVKRT